MFKKDYSVQFKADGDDGGHIVAYAATFDREPDSYGDVIAPGAFKNTLEEWKESGNVIPLLFGHRTDDPSMNIGGVDSIEEDERGLRIEATFDKDSETAQYVRRLVLEKRLSKLSFAYDVLDEGTIVLDDGREANELRDIKLYEVSLVPIPANGHAEVVEAKAADTSDVADDSDDDDNPSPVDDSVSDVAGDFESFSDTIASIKAALSDLYDSVFKFVYDISELLETIDIEDIKAALAEPADDDTDDVDDNVDIEASDDESDDGSSNRSEDNAEDSDTSNAEDPDGVDDPDDDDSDGDDDRKKEVAEAIVKMAKYIY